MVWGALFLGFAVCFYAWLIVTADDGYQDEAGFHYGRPPISQHGATEAHAFGRVSSPQQADPAALLELGDFPVVGD